MSITGTRQGGGRQGWSTDAQGVKTYTSEDVGHLSSYFGAPQTTLDPKSNLAITAKTLEEGYTGYNPEVTKFLVSTIVDGQGWWFAFAPPRIMSMNQRIDIMEMELTSAKLVPEGAPHEIVQYNERSLHSKLLRGALGGKMTTGFFARPDGKQIFALATQQIASGFWLLARVRVANAILNAKQYWKARAEEEGIPTNNLLAVSEQQRTDFGMLQKYPKALYQLHHSCREILARGNVVPNIAILPVNCLNSLALTEHETEAFRVGTDTAKTRLVLGGRSLVNVFEGLTLYEDIPHTANNLPVDDYTSFEKPTMTGEFNFISDQYYNPTCDDDCATLQISTQIYDLAKSRWEEVTLKQIIDQNLDMRWAEDGSLANTHKDLPYRIRDICKKLGITDPGPDIDPFIAFSQAAKDAGARNGGYYDPEYWGEVNPSFLSTEKIIRMARNLKRVSDKTLSADDTKNISALQILGEELADPPRLLDDTLQAFWAAISFQNYSGDSPYLVANEYGVPSLPVLDNPQGRTTPSLLAIKNGVRYVVLQSTRVIGNYLSRVVYFMDESGAYPGRATGALGAAWTSTANPAVPTWTPIDPLDVPVLIASYPTRAYGYGTLPGLRYLASLRGNNTIFAGWRDDIEVAHRGIQSFKKFTKSYNNLIPNTPLSEVQLLPEFLRSGNQEYDKETMLWISSVDKSPYPFHVKTFSQTAAVTNLAAHVAPTGYQPYYIASITYQNAASRIPLLNAVVVDPPVRTNVKLQQLFGVARDDLNVYYTGASGAVPPVPLLVFINLLLKHPNVPQLLVKALASADSQQYDNLNKRLSSSFRYNLESFILSKLPGATFDNNAFLILLIHSLFLMRPAAVISADFVVPVLNVLHTLLSYAQEGVKINRILSEADINAIMTGPVLGKGKLSVNIPAPVPQNPADVEQLGDAATVNLWVNSRLVVSPHAWQGVFSSGGGITEFDSLLIRPSNPLNPFVPLLGNVYSVSANVGDRTVFGRSVKQIIETHAKSHQDVRRSDPAMQALGGYRRDWYNTERARQILAETERLSNPEEWNQTRAGSYSSPILQQLVGWATTLGAEDPQNQSGSDLPRLVDRINLKVRLNELSNRMGSSPEYWFARGLLFARIHHSNVRALTQENIAPWYTSFLIARPFIRQVAGAAVWAAGGDKTAQFGWNYAQAYLTLNSAADMWNLKYIVWLNCIIIDETRILIRENVLLTRYIGGRGTIPFTNPSAFDVKNPASHDADMFIFNLGGEMTRKELPDVISIAGALDRMDFPGIKNSTMFEQNKLQLPIAYYIDLWGFDRLNDARPRIDRHTFAKSREDNRINVNLFPGDQRDYNSAAKRYTNNSRGNSHWSGFGFADDLNLLPVANGSRLNNNILQSNLLKNH